MTILFANRLIVAYLVPPPTLPMEISWEFFQNQVEADNIGKVTILGDVVLGSFKRPVIYPPGRMEAGSAGRDFATDRPPSAEADLEQEFLKRGVPVNARPPDQGINFGRTLLLGFGLPIVLIGIPLLGWHVYAAMKGKSPSKQLLGMTVVHLNRGRPAGLFRMAFRGLVAKPLLGFLSVFLLGIPLLWLLWDKDRQQPWDKLAGTVVVDDSRERAPLGARRRRVDAGRG